MAITVLGNHSKGFLGHGVGGNGSANIPVGMGWTTIIASAAGDEHLLQLSSIVIGDINQGVYFQIDGGSAVIDFTLANPGIALDPDPEVQPSVPWGNAITVTPTAIKSADVLFTVARIVFSVPGSLYVGVR